MTFNEIPSNNLVPLFMTEISNVNAVKGGAMPQKNILVGQALDGNSEFIGTPVQVRSATQADAAFGQGSQLALMCRAFLKNSKNSDLWALAVADDQTNGAKASGTITASVTDVLESTGTLYLMIGGQAVNVTCRAGNTAANVASAIAARINALGNLPVVATVADAVVTVTAKNAGAFGNGIDIRYNHNQGEELPEGLTVTISAMANGAGDASYEDAGLAEILAGTWYNSFVIGSSDSTNIAYFNDILDERWTATVQQTAALFVSQNALTTKSGLQAFGNAQNAQVIFTPGIPKTPTPGFEVASATLGVIAPLSLEDPAAPLANVVVKGIVAPRYEDKIGLTDGNDLLRAGVGLLKSDDAGNVILGRCVTTYKRTAAGAEDTSYQQLEVIYTLAYLRWYWNNHIATKFPRAKLADDGNVFGPEAGVIVTPTDIKAELLECYDYWYRKGLVQNKEEFEANCYVARDPDDDNAIQIYIPADLVDQLFVGKSLLAFK